METQFRAKYHLNINELKNGGRNGDGWIYVSARYAAKRLHDNQNDQTKTEHRLQMIVWLAPCDAAQTTEKHKQTGAQRFCQKYR